MARSELEMLRTFASSLKDRQVALEFTIWSSTEGVFNVGMHLRGKATTIEQFESKDPVWIAGWMLKWLLVWAKKP